MSNYDILIQLAHTTLLPEEMSKAVLAGDTLPLQEIVMALVIGARDCEAVISKDPKTTLTERIISRQCLTISFLSALVAQRESQ
jgi:hypothetical protein